MKKISRGRGKNHWCYKHGMTGTSIFNLWVRMFSRCYNKNHPEYRLYGARGIKVCLKWRNFKEFLKDMGKKPKDMTLERINNNKGYSPENCKWATRSEQSNNTRRNVNISFKGKTLNLAQWAKELKVKRWLVKKTLDKLKED